MNIIKSLKRSWWIFGYTHFTRYWKIAPFSGWTHLYFNQLCKNYPIFLIMLAFKYLPISLCDDGHCLIHISPIFSEIQKLSTCLSNSAIPFLWTSCSHPMPIALLGCDLPFIDLYWFWWLIFSCGLSFTCGYSVLITRKFIFMYSVCLVPACVACTFYF